MEAYLADAVIIANFLVAEFNNDVVFVDGGVVDLGVVDGEESLRVRHCGEGKRG